MDFKSTPLIFTEIYKNSLEIYNVHRQWFFVGFNEKYHQIVRNKKLLYQQNIK